MKCARCGQSPEANIHIEGIVSNSHRFLLAGSGNVMPEPTPILYYNPFCYCGHHPTAHRDGACDFMCTDCGPLSERQTTLDPPILSKPVPRRSLRQQVGRWLKGLGARLSGE